MPPPRKPSPRRRERRTRSRSYSPRPSHSGRKRSGSRSPRDARGTRRSRSPEWRRSPPRRRSRSPREWSPRQTVRKSSPPRRSPRRRSGSPIRKPRSPVRRSRSPVRRSRSLSIEQGQPVKRVAADSSGKRISAYRSRSPSPVQVKRSRDDREYGEEPRRNISRRGEQSRRYSSPGRSQERNYSPRRRSQSPRRGGGSPYGGKMYSDKQSGSRGLVGKKRDEIESVTIIPKARLERLDKRFQTLEQISRGSFDFEENITIGIHRGPSHVSLDKDIPVDYSFNTKSFLMLFPKKETHRAIFDRDEILQFHHDDILDEEAYVEKRTITVQPTEKSRQKWTDSLDYKITVGGRSSRDAPYEGSDRRMVRDSSRRRSRSRDPEVTVRLDPKPDPRYERLFRATQERRRSRSRSRDRVIRDPHDLRHNLNKRRDDDDDDYRDRGRDRNRSGDRGRDRSPDRREVVDARRRIEARRSERGSSRERDMDLHITKTELKERRRSQDRLRKEKGRASLEKELPDFKNRPESSGVPGRYRSPSEDHPRFLDRLETFSEAEHEKRGASLHDGEIQKVWIFGTGEMQHLKDLGRQTSLGTDLGLLERNIMVYWYTKRGLKFRDVLQAVHKKLDKGFTPEMIILHCGGNDLKENENDLESDVRMTVDAILNEIPKVKIVWSMILPRWLGPGDVSSINRRRSSLNEKFARIVLDSGGCYLRYPSITLRENRLYRESHDGDLVLSDEGYDRLLETLKGGIVSILHRGITIHPELTDVEPAVSDYVNENPEKFRQLKPRTSYRGRGYRGRSFRGGSYRGSSRSYRGSSRTYRGRGRGRPR